MRNRILYDKHRNTVSELTVKDLLEASVHFGHQTKRWNPKMKPYILGARSGVYIINLQKTLRSLIEAQRFITKTVSEGGTVLFVGTKKQAQNIIKEEAQRCGAMYVNSRWLGGTLTNFPSIKKNIDRLKELDKLDTEGSGTRVTKKQAMKLRHEKEKLAKYFEGLRDMKNLPTVLFVVDTRKDHIAVREARKTGIPVVAILDTNCDPEGIQQVIPGNNDGIRAIKLYSAQIADACLEGARLREEKLKESNAQSQTAVTEDKGEQG